MDDKNDMVKAILCIIGFAGGLVVLFFHDYLTH